MKYRVVANLVASTVEDKMYEIRDKYIEHTTTPPLDVIYFQIVGGGNYVYLHFAISS